MLLTAGGLVAYVAEPAEAPLAVLAAATALSGLGLGLTIAPTMGSLYEAVPAASVARASSALMLLNQLGGVSGIALAAGLVQGRGTQHGDFATAFGCVALIAVVAAASALALPGRVRRR